MSCGAGMNSFSLCFHGAPAAVLLRRRDDSAPLVVAGAPASLAQLRGATRLGCTACRRTEKIAPSTFSITAVQRHAMRFSSRCDTSMDVFRACGVRAGGPGS